PHVPGRPLDDVAQPVRRDGIDDEVGLYERLLEVGRRPQILRQLPVLEVARVRVLLVDLPRAVLRARPEDGRHVARGECRDRGAPGAGADHAHAHLPRHDATSTATKASVGQLSRVSRNMPRTSATWSSIVFTDQSAVSTGGSTATSTRPGRTVWAPRHITS